MYDAASGRDETPAEADKDRLIAELREAVRARDEFVATIAHELRNPMMPILIQVGGLLGVARDPDRCRPEVMAPRLELLERAVREFVRRSTALLDVSRIAAGNIRVEAGEVDLSRLVRGAVERADIAARMARSPLEADLQEGVVGWWDRRAVEQVVENLLSNAVKFGAGKPVDVALTADGRIARLAIRDHGTGISEEDRARIFGRFEQAVDRREHGGFGVGLWLARQLVIAMGGAIDVEGTPGGGASFIVTLPLTMPGSTGDMAG